MSNNNKKKNEKKFTDTFSYRGAAFFYIYIYDLCNITIHRSTMCTMFNDY